MVRFSIRAAIKNVGLLCFGGFLWSLFSQRPHDRGRTPVKVQSPQERERDPVHKPQCKDYQDWNYTWDGGPLYFTGHHTEVRWRSLYFVRHGQYHSNGPNAGHLTDIGKMQARDVGERLVELGLNFSRLETSTSPRAVETAEIIEYQLLEVNRAEPRLTKFTHNPDIREGWPTMPKPTAIYPNRTEKSIEWEKQRMAKAYMKIFERPPKGKYSDTTELYVCHGNLISYFVLRSLQVPIERFLRLKVLQASITLIDVNSKGLFKVRIVGDVGHLAHNVWTDQ